MSFFATVSLEDLHILRQVVRNVHMKHYPDEWVTDHEADKIIEAFGEEPCQNLIRAAVDSKVHAL